MALKWLSGIAVQGSADAFVELEMQTGLSNVARSAYRIRRLEWVFPPLIGADCNATAILRRSSSATATPTNGSVQIAAKQRVMELTTSGMVIQDTTISDSYEKDLELLIVEETLYLQLDSNGTSAANALTLRIGYEVRSITENERLAIQASY